MKYNIVISKRCKTQLKKYENHKKAIINIVDKLANGGKIRTLLFRSSLKGSYKSFKKLQALFVFSI